jgi:hypothetical protein
MLITEVAIFGFGDGVGDNCVVLGCEMNTPALYRQEPISWSGRKTSCQSNFLAFDLDALLVL